MKYRGHRTFVANSLRSSPWSEPSMCLSSVILHYIFFAGGRLKSTDRFKHPSSRSPTEGQNDKTNGLKNLTNGAGGRTGFLAPTCGFALGSFTSEMLSLIWIVMHVDVLGWRHRPLVTRTKDVLVENSPSSLDFCCHVCGNTAIRRQYPCNTIRPFQSSTYIRFKEFKHSLKCK